MYHAPPPSPAVSSTTPSSERQPGIAVVNQVHAQKFGLSNGPTSGIASMQNQFVMPQQPRNGNSGSQNGFGYNYVQPQAMPAAIPRNCSNQPSQHLAPVTNSPAPSSSKKRKIKTRPEEDEDSYLFDVEYVRLNTYRLFKSLENNPQALLKARQKIINSLFELQIEALSESV